MVFVHLKKTMLEDRGFPNRIYSQQKFEKFTEGFKRLFKTIFKQRWKNLRLSSLEKRKSAFMKLNIFNLINTIKDFIICCCNCMKP